MPLFNNALTALRTPGMFASWLRWNGRLLGASPQIEQPLGGAIKGFRSFSEYWGAMGGIPSSSEVQFIKRFAGSTGVMIDVGANVGALAVTLAHARPTLPTHAFEPSPETFAILNANLKANGLRNARAHQIALGAAKGRVQFRNDPRSSPTNRMLASTDSKFGSAVEVDVMPLDEFIEQHQLREVAFLKVDVEGFEAAVLSGASKLLRARRCQAGLIELCPANLHAVGLSAADLLAVVHDLGYDLRFLDDNGLPGVAVTEENAASVTLTNVALLPA